MVSKALLICFLAAVAVSNAQRELSVGEMQGLFGHKKYAYPSTDEEQAHTCAYLKTSGNKYNGNKEHLAYLECNCVRHVTDCNDRKMSVERKCCPGFKKFNFQGKNRCNERVFPRDTFQSTLNSLGASDAVKAIYSKDYGASFDDQSAAYTFFVVKDEDDMKLSSVEKSASEVPDFKKPAYLHVAQGRYYTQSLQQAHPITTLYSPDGSPRDIKFTRYSNGIMCVECSMIKDANYEAANGVVHFLDFPLFSSANSKTIAEILQADHGYFWSPLPQKIKDQLASTTCAGWFTVFVPSQSAFQGGSDAAATAANHVINGLWCSSALISKSSSNMATMSGDVLQLQCSGGQRNDIVVASNGRTAKVDGSSRGVTFDRMATNGVIHVIDGTLQPRKTQGFRFAVQKDKEDPEELKEASLFDDFDRCGIKMSENKKYIVLQPSAKAMKKFKTKKSTSRDFSMYRDNLEARCNLMKYHILESEDGLTDLDRVMHLQKHYKTLLGENKISDFLLAEGQKLMPYFMKYRVLNTEKFSNGHIYVINGVMLPPLAKKWAYRRISDAVKLTIDERKSVLERMVRQVGEDTSSTFFVAPSLSSDSRSVKMHTSRLMMWTPYLRVGDTMELPTRLEGVVLILRREAKYYYTLSYDGLTREKQAVVQGANHLRKYGVVWYINKALPIPQYLRRV